MKKVSVIVNDRSEGRAKSQLRKNGVVAVDLFCGAGGLTRGLLDADVSVVAGYDIDEACRHPFEHNNSPARFIGRSVSALKGEEIAKLYPQGAWHVLVGCAPCQPFSRYTQGSNATSDEKWGLLNHFGRLVEELMPDVVSMENVPELERHSVYDEFVRLLSHLRYHVSPHKVYCPDYGIPQHRTRLVLFASRLGPISIIPPTHQPKRYLTVKRAIGSLKRIGAGEIYPRDPLHRTSRLSDTNWTRIRHSKPGGSWRDWPDELVAKCHRKKKGRTYPSVYGRMRWNEPSPTITTQFYGFGNGRFGHPEQHRALSLREGAILQTFPRDYEFVKPDDEYRFKVIGRLIGNAVPVRLGAVVGQTIRQHLEKFDSR